MDVDAQVGEQSATLSVSSNNEGFPEFAELSYELRALIWKEAIQSPKIIEVEGHLVERKPSLGWDKPLVYDLRLSMTSTQNSQNIINACSESKRTFENFRASLILENKSHTLYIRNFTSLVRTFEQGRERAPQGFRAIFNDKIFVPENVQNIAIDTRYSSYDNIAAAHHDDRMQRDPTREPHTPANTVRFLAMFQELKTLTVVMKTGRYKDANPHPMEFMPGYIGMCVATTRYSVEDIWSLNQDQTERAKAYQDAHRLKSQLLSAAKILRDADTRGNLTAINHALGKKVPMQSELNVKVVQWMKP